MGMGPGMVTFSLTRRRRWLTKEQGGMDFQRGYCLCKGLEFGRGWTGQGLENSWGGLMVESREQVAERMQGWGWGWGMRQDWMHRAQGRSLNVSSEDGGQLLKDLIRE